MNEGKMKGEAEEMKKNWIYQRGDVYLANLSPFVGSEQGGKRPVVVLQNNAGNFFSNTLIIAPMTSRNKRNLPTHCNVQVSHMEGESTVELEQIRTIDKARIISYIGKVKPEQMSEIEERIRVSLHMEIPVCETAC